MNVQSTKTVRSAANTTRLISGSVNERGSMVYPKFLGVVMAVTVIVPFVIFAGCSGEQTVNNEATTSAIRAAEEVGASSVPSASLYLQLAKEELQNATGLAKDGEKEKAESMLLRAQAVGELAVALSRS